MDRITRTSFWTLTALAWGVVAWVGCDAAGINNTDPSTSGSGSGGDSTVTTSASGSGGATATSSSSGPTVSSGPATVGAGGGGGGTGACLNFSEEAQPKPAAMVIVLDRTTSMDQDAKWSTAQIAIIQAVDKDVFDTMDLGLLAFPGGAVGAPQCLCDAITAQIQELCDIVSLNATECCALGLHDDSDATPEVSCGLAPNLQVPIQAAGIEKSNGSSGPRKDILTYLTFTTPDADGADGSPIYEALAKGYEALEAVPNVDERFLVLITDGGFSCTSVAETDAANRQAAAIDDEAGCPDWEYPVSVSDLMAAKHGDATKPINTFVVGVPGSDSNGEMQGAIATAPYSMKLALSTYAVSGSPDTVPAACDKNAVFTEGGSLAGNPCHFDMTGQGFDATALANNISEIRKSALGCVYPVPEAPPNETVDFTKVNVETTLDGTVGSVPKRMNASDDCETDGCWDYINNFTEIELIGAACDELNSATAAKVEMFFGCATILK